MSWLSEASGKRRFLGMDPITMSTVISMQAGSEPIKQAVMHESQEYLFGHEKLDVYREAIGFIAWLCACWSQSCEPVT